MQSIELIWLRLLSSRALLSRGFHTRQSPINPSRTAFPPDQRTDTAAAAKTASPLPEAAGACSAVNQLPKSVVQ
jgi:hypothetical protein